MRPKAPAEIARAVRRAGELVLSGEPVAVPTETVYGLAADATNDRAVAKIYEAKGRPSFNPLIIHVADVAMARRYVDFPPLAEKLAAAFWPGPLTLVLPRREDSGISHLVSAGLETLGVRAPRHPMTQRLIREIDRPLAAPSANRSGSVSPTTADHVCDSLGGRVRLILDGGPCGIGVESTIMKIDGDRATLLRPGGVPRSAIEAAIGKPLETSAPGKIEAPGMLESHYAPRAVLRLGVLAPRADEAFLGFGQNAAAGDAALNLSINGDLAEAAANLFAHLRALDAICRDRGLIGIAAAPVPNEELGEAINDRLFRAAAARK